MKMLLSFAFALGLVSMVSAEDKKDPSNGKWVVESVIRDGKAIDAYKGATRVHDNGKYTFTPPAESKIPPTTGTYTIDTTKTPHTFDAIAKGGTFDGKTLVGIFKLDGDTLTVAFAEPGKERPTKFESTAGSGVVLTVYKKAK